MAGWISSKLKVAETFLQQIDQQAAESLGTNEKSRSDTLNGEFQTKLESLPLKDQLKKSNNDVYSNLSTVSDSERKTAKKKLEATVTKPSSSHSRVLAEGDWTELLSSPKPISTTERSNGISALRATKDTKKNSLLISNSTPLEVKKSHKNSSRVPKSLRRLEIENANGGISVSSKQSDGSDVSNFVQKKPVRHSQSDKGSTGAGENGSIATFSNSKNDKSGDSTMLETAASVDSEAGKESHSELNGKNIGLVEGSLQVQVPGPDPLVVSESVTSSNVAEMMGRVDRDESVDISRRDESDLPLTGSVLHVVPGSSGESKGPTTCKLDSTNASSSESDESSDSAIDSASASDSEEENRRREEKRKRREQIIAEKAAAKAAEAIRERENIVARLEGEKQSLEKILEEQQKQQAQEASELQMNMMETMEAVEVEKQKHNSTRMESLARLAALETTNAELARSLATTQRNLEVKVQRVADLRQEIELKEVGQEELRRTISNINKKLSTLSQGDHSKGVEFGQEILEADSIMRRTGLPARDLRVLDPLLSYPSSILGRERAIVINLEHIKAIITATEVLVLNSKDPLVAPFVHDLQQRVSDSYGASQKQVTKSTHNDTKVKDKASASPQFAADYDSAVIRIGISRPVHASLEPSPTVLEVEENNQGLTLDISKDGGPKMLPFEFRALEVCLESACRCLEYETSALEQEAYPALDELTSKISTLNLERVRQIKSRLVAISGRVQKVRDELEHLLDDDMDMAEMYLTDKLVHQASDKTSSSGELDDDTLQLDVESDEETKSINGKTKSTGESFAGLKPDIVELEMLLEAYFVQTEGILNKLSTMREYVDDTEDYINIMLDDKQNQLLHMGVLLSTATLLLGVGIVITGLFGMNIDIRLFEGSGSTKFVATTIGSVGGCFLLYGIAIAWGKKQGLLA